MSKKHRNVSATLNDIDHFLILASIITRCISISAFASFIAVPIIITISAIGLKICAITAKIKKCKSIIKKKKKKHDKTVLLAKSKLNSIEALISKALIDSVVSHDLFVFINNVLKEYKNITNERRNRKFKYFIKFIEDFSLFIKQCYRIV